MVWKLLSSGILIAAMASNCHACETGVHVWYPLAAGCLVRNDNGELLLVQSADDAKWTFPAGSRSSIFEKGGDIAARETLEEAGVTVVVGEEACGVKSFGFFSANLFIGYCCSEDPTGQTPSTNDPSEIAQAQFLDRNTVAGFMDEDLRFPDQKQLLLDVIDGNLC